MDNLTLGGSNEKFYSSDLPKILIVDDEDLFRRSMTRVLVKSGFQTISVENGDECLKTIVETNDISLIILDQMMPGLTVHQIIKRIKSRSKMIPILITSGYPKSGVEPWLQDHYLDFIQKPFMKEDLLTKINKLISKPSFENGN